MAQDRCARQDWLQVEPIQCVHPASIHQTQLTIADQALSSFNSTQSLNHPDAEDIEQYRTYLQTEQPIAEAETHFLDPTDDLVSIYSDNLAPPPFLRPSAAAPFAQPVPPLTLEHLKTNPMNGLKKNKKRKITY